MARTTPPPPVDIAAIFPELRTHAGTTTRLHPRPGMPTAHDSSAGGPLLWPADEPWPHCEDGHDYLFQPHRPETIRRWRRILDAAWGRTRRGEQLQLTEQERAELPDLDDCAPAELAEQPIAMVPVLQLYRRDAPGFLGPDAADLLQVLWCPLDHGELGYNPRVLPVWRRAADVGAVLPAPPEPLIVSESYLPEPCLLHPEQVREYEYGGLLPQELDERIQKWEEDQEERRADDEPAHSYQFDLSIAPGWKLGGFASWHLTDPHPVDCGECGEPMRLLLRIASHEWDGGSGSWRPIEDAAPGEFSSLHSDNSPTAVSIGRSYSLWIFYCPVSFDHPHGTAMQ
ncbi:hypothetical protein [Catellatospora citrea]|uniref:DUF1963 domain-containing protein n=1 Tax=Catellatospora citrea TaxID=53366 RepID=A0A8J3KQ53_9ACTN|nr:hypothetical protein [Catellatospora citrea]RKE11495.1 hypothetical protein C8E86_6423 [Catellatospora citrea]GIF99994.1 hypothetical protein Cci01nite_50880 [Catellatospora citrea]